MKAKPSDPSLMNWPDHNLFQTKIRLFYIEALLFELLSNFVRLANPV